MEVVFNSDKDRSHLVFQDFLDFLESCWDSDNPPDTIKINRNTKRLIATQLRNQKEDLASLHQGVLWGMKIRIVDEVENEKILKENIPNEIPVISVSPGNAGEQIDAALNDVLQLRGSTSRDRPYDGQTWTTTGERGKTLVAGLTMRDLADCLAKAFLLSAKPLPPEEWLKCWDFSSGEAVATPYLLEKQKEDEYVYTKVETGDWRYSDLYKALNCDFDPVAVIQNMCCEIEKMMEIYPNIPQKSED